MCLWIFNKDVKILLFHYLKTYVNMPNGDKNRTGKIWAECPEDWLRKNKKNWNKMGVRQAKQKDKKKRKWLGFRVR